MCVNLLVPIKKKWSSESDCHVLFSLSSNTGSCCQWLWSDFLRGFRYEPDTRHQWPLTGRKTTWEGGLGYGWDALYESLVHSEVYRKTCKWDFIVYNTEFSSLLYRHTEVIILAKSKDLQKIVFTLVGSSDLIMDFLIITYTDHIMYKYLHPSAPVKMSNFTRQAWF